MKVITKRCMHCGTEYMYHASGGDVEFNNENYCPECYGVMKKALKNIPVKFVPKFKELPDWLKSRVNYNIFKEIKDKFVEEKNNSYFRLYAVKSFVTPLIMDENGNYHYVDDNLYEEEYEYQGMAFRVSWDKDKPIKKTIKVLSEYDVLKKEFTDKVWHINSCESRFIPLSNSPKLDIKPYTGTHEDIINKIFS